VPFPLSTATCWFRSVDEPPLLTLVPRASHVFLLTVPVHWEPRDGVKRSSSGSGARRFQGTPTRARSGAPFPWMPPRLVLRHVLWRRRSVPRAPGRVMAASTPCPAACAGRAGALDRGRQSGLCGLPAGAGGGIFMSWVRQRQAASSPWDRSLAVHAVNTLVCPFLKSQESSHVAPVAICPNG
jgi:hypothetical protein